MAVLFRKFVGITGVNLVSKVITFFTVVIIARKLSVEDFGHYSYMLSVMSLVALPSIAGLPNLIVREVSISREENRVEYTAGFLEWSKYYIMVISLISFLLAVFFFELGWINVTGNYFYIALCIVPLRSFLVRVASIYNGSGYPVLSVLPESLFVPIITMLGLGGLLWLSNFTISNLFIISFISYFIVLVVSSLVISSKITFSLDSKRKVFDLKKWHKALIPFSLITIVNVFNVEISTIILGHYATAQDVAFFKVASQAVILISLGLKSINPIIMPEVAKYYRKGDLLNAQGFLSKSVRVISLYSLPIIFLLLVFGREILSFVFGDEYVSAYILLAVLCAGQFFNVFMGSVGVVLNMTGNERESLSSLSISVFINILLNFILIPLYGGLGAAISVSVSLIFVNSLMAYKVYYLVGLKTWFRF